MAALRSFALAPMDRLFGAITGAVLALPFVILVVGLIAGLESLRLTAPIATFMVAIYAFVFYRMRPSRFEIDRDELRIEFPTRTIAVRREAVARAEVVSMDAFRRRYPRPIRVGAGGLWGGFGSLWTKNGKVQFYISRQDGLVLIEFDNGRMPLLISPESPDGFVAALRS